MWSRLHEVNNLFEYRIVNSFICEKFILINKGDYLISDSIDTIDKLYFNGVSTLASKRSGDSFTQERMKYNVIICIANYPLPSMHVVLTWGAHPTAPEGGRKLVLVSRPLRASSTPIRGARVKARAWAFVNKLQNFIVKTSMKVRSYQIDKRVRGFFQNI